MYEYSISIYFVLIPIVAELHHEMLKGLLANTTTYNILICGFCKLGRLIEATKVLSEITKDGIFPDCKRALKMVNELTY